MIDYDRHRDGTTVTALLAAATLGAWGLLLHFHHAMAHPGHGSIGVAPLLSLFLMWSLMMAAMMMPAAWPMVQTYDKIRKRQGERAVLTAHFAGAYLVIWITFSLAAALLQLALIPPTASQVIVPPHILGGAVFIGAGLYQFTQLKHACLNHCRTPLGFILKEWRDGSRGAMTMGFHHGLHCLGCCWAMMLVMLAVGATNMAWMGVITLWVILEKRPSPWAKTFSLAIGWFLIGWGLWSLAL